MTRILALVLAAAGVTGLAVDDRRDIDDAVDFAISLGPAGEIIRLAGPDGEKYKPQVIAALREVLQQFRQSGGIWAPSSAWFVTASRPHP